MPSIYAIGESIYDIIFKDKQPVAAKAGGSMLNTTVSLGRLGLPIHFVSEYANDRVGQIIHDFLRDNAVNTDYCSQFQDGKTAIALAFLNEQNDASYTFHKLYPDKRLEIEFPKFSHEDIVLFGAFYSLVPEVRKPVLSFVKAAKDAGALIIYDPNIRSPHKKEIFKLRQMIYENLHLADIVRASDEDFMTMFDVNGAEKAYEIVKENGCDILIYTQSSTVVNGFFGNEKLQLPVPPIESVSTIGAGDSFNAGLIFALIRLGIHKDNIQKIGADEMKQIINTAIAFGSHVCTHYDNYITQEYANKMAKLLNC
jgi:fructokinase